MTCCVLWLVSSQGRFREGKVPVARRPHGIDMGPIGIVKNTFQKGGEGPFVGKLRTLSLLTFLQNWHDILLEEGFNIRYIWFMTTKILVSLSKLGPNYRLHLLK